MSANSRSIRRPRSSAAAERLPMLTAASSISQVTPRGHAAKDDGRDEKGFGDNGGSGGSAGECGGGTIERIPIDRASIVFLCLIGPGVSRGGSGEAVLQAAGVPRMIRGRGFGK